LSEDEEIFVIHYYILVKFK